MWCGTEVNTALYCCYDVLNQSLHEEKRREEKRMKEAVLQLWKRGGKAIKQADLLPCFVDR